MNRDEAKAAGLKRYSTGKPCSRGHITFRYVCDHSCVECAKEKLRRRDKQRCNALQKIRYRENRGREKANARRKADPQRFNDALRRYYARHPELCRARARQAAKDRPDLNRARRARRRGAEKRATPKWASPSAMTAMFTAAVAAEELFEIPVHVDHTVPLTSKLVCGLHCEANLRLLPGRENQAKSNRSWPDMWS